MTDEKYIDKEIINDFKDLLNTEGLSEAKQRYHRGHITLKEFVDYAYMHKSLEADKAIISENMKEDTEMER